MIRIKFPEAKARRLGSASRQATDRKLLDRLLVVRPAHRGRKHEDIAADLGIIPRTARRRLDAHPGRGPEGLRPRKAEGK